RPRDASLRDDPRIGRIRHAASLLRSSNNRYCAHAHWCFVVQARPFAPHSSVVACTEGSQSSSPADPHQLLIFLYCAVFPVSSLRTRIVLFLPILRKCIVPENASCEGASACAPASTFVPA